jgi:hypothetical protein
MKHDQKRIWLPWSCASVWGALIDPQALVFWTQLHVCEEAPDRSLVPGTVLQWEPARPICSCEWFLTVEQMLPRQAIHCSFSTRAFQGKLDIRFSPEEGDEATSIASVVTVEHVAPHGCFWVFAPLVRGMIQRRVAQAFRMLDALLEYRQEQVEQGFNAVYTYWQRLLIERERFYCRLIAQAMRYR